MEMMPYHSAFDGAVPPETPAGLLSIFGVPGTFEALQTGDWRDGLPALGDATLTLRELTLEDAPSLFAHLTTEEVARFISPPPTSVAGFEDFIRWTHLRRSQGQYACFGIVPAGETRAVGMFQIRVRDVRHGLADWGFVLGAAYWGTGIFLAGARRVVDFALAHMGIERLEARSVLENGRGNGALRKVGAERIGVLLQSFEKDGKRLDQVLWVIRRGIWRAALAEGATTVH